MKVRLWNPLVRHEAYYMLTDEELLEARQRAHEYRQMAEEYCPCGGFLFGDIHYEQVMEARETRQN